jgi:hypothetical protein
VYPGKPWFATRVLQVKNTDRRPWILKSVFHFVLPRENNKDTLEAKNTRWVETAVGASLGVVDPEHAFRVRYWLDNGGGTHPDARREVDVDLPPGKIHVEPSAVLCVAALKSTDDAAWKALAEQIGAGAAAVSAVGAPER